MAGGASGEQGHHCSAEEPPSAPCPHPAPVPGSPAAAGARPALGWGREGGREGPRRRAAGALTPVLRSSVPPRAAESRVVLRPTSEGSVWDIQLVIMAMVLSTTPILSSGTDIAPRVASCARAAPAPRPRAASGGGHRGGQGRPAVSPRPLGPPPHARRHPALPGHGAPPPGAGRRAAGGLCAPRRGAGTGAAAPSAPLRALPPPGRAAGSTLSARRTARGGRDWEAGTRLATQSAQEMGGFFLPASAPRRPLAAGC